MENCNENPARLSSLSGHFLELSPRLEIHRQEGELPTAGLLTVAATLGV
jgi:hypothetical protein